ncbi:hypothetical protein MTBBW1_80151 [Desulfamplus magnetovallimortis]|uniref:Uncharacterized protein n=1 Tax=Desulfamplus magnetovallimortis TaxID=1246637 RepID=L0R5G1_9BACT|nr:hypothetical protein [Desulfamplus magnetovallimortis]CCO06757.1 hypothetical protein DEMABW1_80151 [Desulfamplus magnetovallimortis BW-1]SLM32808.1 hypothetical protein MTBBW1_80151 [Desulfamplus magnetovallimortis]
MNRVNGKFRYYLNGMDWVMAGLDALNKRNAGIGNHSQIVIEIAGTMKQELLLKWLDLAMKSSFLFRGELSGHGILPRSGDGKNHLSILLRFIFKVWICVIPIKWNDSFVSVAAFLFRKIR